MIRRFVLNRKEDKGGVSGTGIVAEGVVFTNGKCIISWRTKFTSVAIYDDLATLEAIHGHGGSTKIEWVDARPRSSAKSARRPARAAGGRSSPRPAPAGYGGDRRRRA